MRNARERVRRQRNATLKALKIRDGSFARVLCPWLDSRLTLTREQHALKLAKMNLLNYTLHSHGSRHGM
ncbi:MAG: hypothetical protein ACREL7_04160 [Longimicrobiales bacterium]